MEKLLLEVAACKICKDHLPHLPRPVVTASVYSKIVVIGQAPGTKVHASGIPWDDPSGDRLRKWLGVSKEQFYDTSLFALMPIGFCYPGKRKSGDLPPRPECAPAWHQKLLDKMTQIKLILLIGQYAQKYYLKGKRKHTLTNTVISFRDYLPQYFPLPHPSPRNIGWFKKNTWFEEEVVDILQAIVNQINKDNMLISSIEQ